MMRVLEPRILLDAAAVETALDIAGQAVHNQLADDYLANTGMVEQADSLDMIDAPLAEPLVVDEEIALNSEPRRTDHEIVFIDGSLPDIDGLLASLEPGVVVHVLDPEQDGVLQMAELLEEETGFEAIHIFSHGEPGALQLGTATLNAESTLGIHRGALAAIGDALTENGDLLIYGCNFGQGEIGREAAGRLASVTGADIAASDDLTGSESLAGDWDLELELGEVETQAWSAPNWNHILDGYTLEASTPPTVGHLDGGIIGTANTTALWEGAAIFDKGGPQEQAYDIQATLVGLTPNTFATFETAASGDGSMDDFRVVVTNVNPETQPGIREAGFVTIQWQIIDPATGDPAPLDAFDIGFDDLEGIAGQPAAGDTIIVDATELWSYTRETGSDVVVTDDFGDLVARGTQAVNGSNSNISLSFQESNAFLVTYGSTSQVANFDVDGDAALAGFATPDTQATQSLDLDTTQPGNSRVVTYNNVSGVDVPVSLVSQNVEIFEFDSETLDAVTIRLTNAYLGDRINYDETLLSMLGEFGITVDSVTTGVATMGTPAVIEVTLSGIAQIADYETALQSLTFDNNADDVDLNTTTPRIVEFELTDGVISTTGVQTQINIQTQGAAPVAAANIYVEDEDQSIITGFADGLLGNDAIVGGATLTITDARDSLNASIPINAVGAPAPVVHTTPGGAELTLYADGSFEYVPPAHVSGRESIAYTVSGGGGTDMSYATFDIQPVVDDVTLAISQPTPVTAEDAATGAISLTVSTPDVSETQIIFAEDVPIGVILTDGINSFRSGIDGEVNVDITNWDRSQIRALPVQNDDRDIEIVISVENYEIDGSVSFDSQVVTFEINAVADAPLLEVDEITANVDATVALFEVINLQLFDFDGSEEFTSIELSNLPAGSTLFSDNGPIAIVGGTAQLQQIDIFSLAFTPPQIGGPAIYLLEMSATSSEVSPENGVDVSNASVGPLVLRIDLNNDDAAVVANTDSAETVSNEMVNIDVLANDIIPDGGAQVTHINGIPVTLNNPIDLPAGLGSVTVNAFNQVRYTPGPNAFGDVLFEYTARDGDDDSDVATVIVDVKPIWAVTVNGTAVEGGNADVTIGLTGAVGQGGTVSVDVGTIDNTADSTDFDNLTTAFADAIAADGTGAYLFDGTTLSYTAPSIPYEVETNPASGVFNDISATATALNLGNDGLAVRSLGFDFDFFGDTFDEAFISANGYLTFGSPSASSGNVELDGSALLGRPIIAPFFDDLDQGGGNVYAETIGTEPGSRTFIIQWSDVTAVSDGPATGSFQVVLVEATGQVIFNYQDVTFAGSADGGAGASIGLQGSGGIFNNVSHNAATVTDGMSITFNPAAVQSPGLSVPLGIVDDPDFEFSEDFQIRLTNPTNAALSSDAAATVTIEASDNQAPIANDDATSTPETTVRSINVLTNPAGADVDPEGFVLEVYSVEGQLLTDGSMVTLASGATVTMSPTGLALYDPNGQFDHLDETQSTTDTFTYVIVDGLGELSGTATVTVTITGVNTRAVLDLEDDGTTPERNIGVIYLPTDTSIPIAAANASVFDPDDVEVTGLTMEFGGFLQPGDEILAIGATQVRFGTPSVQSVFVGTTTFEVSYDGVNSIAVTRSGGGVLPSADMNSFVRLIQYSNESATDQRGDRTVTFAVNDGSAPGAASVVTINVRGDNEAPTARDDSNGGLPYTVLEDGQLIISEVDLLANDDDPEGDTLTIISVDGLLDGTAYLDGLGNVVFEPAANFSGITEFSYTIGDGFGGSDTARVSINVIPVNDAPDLDLNGAGALEDHADTYVEDFAPRPLVAADATLSDVDSTQLVGLEIVVNNGEIGDRIVAGALPGGISATFSPTAATTGLLAPGSVTITLSGTALADDYQTALRGFEFSTVSDNPVEGVRTIVVTANDGFDVSVQRVSSLTVQGTNDAPVALDDTLATIDEDTTGVYSTADLLANDSDPEGDSLNVISLGAASNGTVTLVGSQITYVPNPDFFGQDTFTYRVLDGQGGEATRTATVNVTAINDAPFLDLNRIDGGGVDYATSYRENDVSIAIVHPSVEITDVDDALFEGATIVLSDGQIGDFLAVGTLPSAISVTITPAGALTSAQPVTIQLSGSASASDYALAFQAITYMSTSDALVDGQRSIELQIDDGDGPSPVATTTIAIVAVNDAPVAGNDSATILEDGTAQFTIAELLSNDVDLDNEPLTIIGVGAASIGTVSQAGSTFTFTPPADYFGPASFTYTVEDGAGVTSTATVTIDVTSVNDRPVVTIQGAIVGSPSQVPYVENDLPVTIFDGLISISDVDDTELDDLTVTLSNAFVGDAITVGVLPLGITAEITPVGPVTADGTIQVVLRGPALLSEFETALQALQFASNSDNINEAIRLLVVQGNDGSDNSLTAGGRILVTAVNDAPVSVADTGLTTLEDTPLLLLPADLLANDTDAEGDTLFISAVGVATNGTVELLPDGSVRFTPLADYFGPATFAYTVSDGQGGTVDVTADLTVQSVDDAPTLDLDTAQIGTVDFATAYRENDPGVSIVSGALSVFDPDSPMLDSATIVLTNASIGDVLTVGPLPVGMAFTASETFPISAAGAVTLTISGPASAADFELALAAISYSSASEDPSEAQRTIVIQVNDGTSDSPVAITRIAVEAVNDQPTSAGVAPFAATEDTQLTIEFSDLLATINDPEGDPVTVLNVGPATNGTVTLSGGQVFFQPDPEFSGTASFDYEVTDNLSAPVTLSATVEVAPVNDSPEIDLNGGAIGTDTSASYSEQAPQVPLVTADLAIIDVDDPDLASVTVTLTNGEAGDLIEVGALPPSITVVGGAPAALAAAGSLDLVLQGPASQADFMAALQALGFSNGSDQVVEGVRIISFTLNDGQIDSNTALTSIAVTAVNDAPIANDDGAPVPLAGVEDVPLIVQPLGNDVDPDGDVIIISEIDGFGIAPGGSLNIAGAIVALAADGVTLTVTPASNFTGLVSFTYSISDGDLIDTATVHIDFAAVNDAPIAVDDGPLGFDEDTSITFDPIAGSLAGIGVDSDVEGDALSIVTLGGQPVIPGGFVDVPEGRLSLAADGRTVTFAPGADVNGAVVVGYGVSDGNSVSEANITFDVVAVNDATVAAGIIANAALTDGEIVNLPLAGFFLDVDGDALSFTATGLPLGLSINASTGIISGQVASDASQGGPYNVTVSATDGMSPIATQTFEIGVTNVAPVVVPTSDVTLREGDSFSISAADLFNDVDGDALTIAVTGLPVWASYDAGTQLITGTVPFDAEGNGSVILNASADDQQGGTTNTTLTLVPVNPAPVAINALPDFVVAEEAAFTLNVTTLFVDGGNDGDALTIAVTGLPNGLEYNAATGIISGTFTAGTGSVAPYTVMVTVDDGQGGVLLESFDIRVTNDTFLAPVDDDDEDEDEAGDTFSAGLRFDQLVDFGSDAPALADLTIGNAISEIGSLQSISSASSIDRLTVRNSTQGLSEPSPFATSLDRDGESGSLDAGVSSEGVNVNSDPRLDRVDVAVVYRGGTVFIALKTDFTETRDGRITGVAATPVGGGDWPAWVNPVRGDFLSATPPVGEARLSIEVRVFMASGEVLVKTVNVQLTDDRKAPVADANLRLTSLDL